MARTAAIIRTGGGNCGQRSSLVMHDITVTPNENVNCNKK